MAIHVARLPLSLDPLIAEAKRRSRRRRLLLAVVAVLIAGAALGTTLVLRSPSALAPPATRLPTLLVNSGPRSLYRWKVQPADAWILFTGDGSGRLGGVGGTGVGHPGHVTWERWTTTQATGSGVIWATNNSLRTVTTYNATVRVFRPVNGHFTRLTLRVSDHGKHYVDTRSIRCGFGHCWYAWERITTRR